MITGGARGIGATTALKFAKEGARVAICDIEEAALGETLAALKEVNPNCEAYVVDVTKRETIETMVEDVMRRYKKIDVLVNNAGILLDAQLQKMTDEQFDKVIDINLKGTYNATRAVIDIMRAQRSGSVINVSSVVGLYGNFGQTNYAATKFGVIGMAKSWAKEHGHLGIRFNAVCPGFVDTNIIRAMPAHIIEAMEQKIALGRFGTEEEIANVYLFLASDESSYITGAVIDVSGYTTI
jgi:3-oxoacyl-[acyl-carrier protein] reductase